MAERTFTTKQIAALVGVATRTLYRWLTEERIREPRRHPRTGHRIWTEADLHSVLLYKNTGIRAGQERQIDLLNQTNLSPTP